ncbi:MAG: peptidoglycan-binding protein [Gaiellaceae bacterium]
MSTVQPKPAARAVSPATTRTLHLTNPLMTGPDVEELQQLLTKSAYGNFHPGTIDCEYGPATAAAVKQAKWALGYPDTKCDQAAGALLVDYLQGAPLPADHVARIAARKHDQAKSLTVRKQIVENATWGIANESQIHYQQLRPIDALHEARRLALRTDCSGFSTLCYAWAGAPDPNGLAYCGAGYTGNLLHNMQRIPQGAVQPGDLVVWGAYPGHHVALVLEAGPDPLLCSHGQERGPLAIRFSEESKYQPAPATWLSCLSSG